VLGDQPMVGSRTVAALLRAWRREGSRPAVAVSRGEGGAWTPPVVLARELWDELMALEGDAGARQLLAHRPELVSPTIRNRIETWLANPATRTRGGRHQNQGRLRVISFALSLLNTNRRPRDFFAASAACFATSVAT